MDILPLERDPNMYVMYRPHYNVNLMSINVNGVSTSVNSKVSSDGSTGSIIDSGTTLAYFSDDVYNHVQNAVSGTVLLNGSKALQFVYQN